MRGRLRAVVGAVFFSCAGVACIFPTSSVETIRVAVDGGDEADGGAEASTVVSGSCTTDAECGTAPCAQLHCIEHQCKPTYYPSGTEPTGTTPIEPVCQHVVCDGSGNLTMMPDTTAVSTAPAPACMSNACTADGQPTFVSDPTKPPASAPGSCTKTVCDPDGGTSTEPDPTNVPAPTTCATYTCNGETAVATPANPTAKCSDLGFVCGTDGTCGTCPAPDAACTEPGVGSRTASAPHDFQGIGNCDTGGRYLCGAVPAGDADYYTYYDNETGIFCQFDPYFEIEPTAPVTMCTYFDCPSVTCPSGSTASTSASGQPGCCLSAKAGGFTGMAVDFCAGGRVTIKVTSASGCAGYQLHFKD
jgi:hypothetical protein